jgi:hypothetical protein
LGVGDWVTSSEAPADTGGRGGEEEEEGRKVIKRRK